MSVTTCMCITCIYFVVVVQLTLIELGSLKTIDIHELAVYTWEGNTPGICNTV